MSDTKQKQSNASQMAERLQKMRELTEATVTGAKAAVDSTAMMAASEAAMNAEALSAASEKVAQSLGTAVTSAVQGASYSTGAVIGSVKGTSGGLILAAQIGGLATTDALKSLVSNTLRAAGKFSEGFLVALEDQEKGAATVRDAAKDLVQGTFDATTGAALGAMGGMATAAGAVAGGAKGAATGAVGGLSKAADGSAEAAWVMSQEVAKGGTEVVRKALRRSES